MHLVLVSLSFLTSTIKLLCPVSFRKSAGLQTLTIRLKAPKVHIRALKHLLNLQRDRPEPLLTEVHLNICDTVRPNNEIVAYNLTEGNLEKKNKVAVGMQ